MRNYIGADIRRILNRSSHAFSTLLIIAAFFSAVYFPLRGEQVTSVALITSACGTLDWLMLIIGLLEMIAVFSEDFKVKTMQVAIGLGINRNKVIVCKLVETVILVTVDAILLIVTTLVIGFLNDVAIPMNVLSDLILALLIKGILHQAIATSLTMIVLFMTQSMILSIFVFILVSAGFLNMLLSMMPMFGITWLENLNLNRLTLSYMVSAFYSRALLGAFDVGSLIGMLVYFAAGLFGTSKLFAKRELDF